MYAFAGHFNAGTYGELLAFWIQILKRPLEELQRLALPSWLRFLPTPEVPAWYQSLTELYNACQPHPFTHTHTYTHTHTLVAQPSGEIWGSLFRPSWGSNRWLPDWSATSSSSWVAATGGSGWEQSLIRSSEIGHTPGSNLISFLYLSPFFYSIRLTDPATSRTSDQLWPRRDVNTLGLQNRGR